MLTAKQLRLLIFNKNYIEKNGIAPSMEEMRKHMNIQSISGVHSYLRSLEERGFIRKLPNRARALEVLKIPEAKNGAEPAGLGGLIQIPYYERIAAGQAVTSWPEPDKLLAVPNHLVDRSRGAHYALRVSGDSMVEKGILDGDIAVMTATNEAKNGDIVAALTDEGEVTLKTLRLSKDKVALEPANPAYKTKNYPMGSVQVQGKLSGIFRDYH